MGKTKNNWQWMVAAAGILLLSACGGSGGAGTASSATSSAGGGNDGTTAGEIQNLTFTSNGATLNFDSDNQDDYLLVLNAVTETPANYTLRLYQGTNRAASLGLENLAMTTNDASEEDVPEDVEEPTQFHQLLRESEEMFRQSPEFREVRPSGFSALTATPSVGSQRGFRVLSTINSITNYQNVTATLRTTTGNLLVYVDQANADNITDADIQTLAASFDSNALPMERNLFGRESDVNSDGHITILMTCVLNRMATSGGLVTGFFFPGDLYQQSTYNPASNSQEIFYTLLPDPSGKCGTSISNSFAINSVLPGVLAHEYQHMTSFNQHVLKNGGSTEEPWLNECLSHLTEDLTGYGNENPSRAKLFLNHPESTPLISSTSPTLAERGGCYLFLRYLYEQSEDGDAFLHRLYTSKRTGVVNLEEAFAGTDSSFDEFPEFINRWSLALAISETGMIDSPKYNYKAQEKDSVTGNLTGVCIRCNAQDGRGTVLDGPAINTVKSFPSALSVSATASQFYRLRQPTGTIQVVGSGNVSLAGSVIRLEGN